MMRNEIRVKLCIHKRSRLCHDGLSLVQFQASNEPVSWICFPTLSHACCLSVVTVVLLAMKNPIQNSKAGSDRASFFETPWDLVRRMGENLRIVDVQDLVLNFVHQSNIIHLDFRGERCWCQAHGRIDPPGTLVITFKGILLEKCRKITEKSRVKRKSQPFFAVTHPGKSRFSGGPWVNPHIRMGAAVHSDPQREDVRGSGAWNHSSTR